MIDFIDKTTEQNGTPRNRDNLMAIQGFQTQTITFESDSLGNVTKVIETNDLGQTKTTTFNDNHSITETFIGDKTITKTTNIIQGGITEVVS